MKRFKLLILAISLIGFGHTFGQQLQVSPSDTFTYSGTLAGINDNHEQNGYIVNNTVDTTRIYWQVVSATMDSIWQLSFCDPNNCYYYSVGQGLGNYGLNHFNAVPGYSNLLRFGVSPNCVADSGKLVIRTWLATDSSGSAKTLYYTANYTGVCVSGVQNVTTTPVISVYPNPVQNGRLVVKLEKTAVIQIFNSSGVVVLQKQLKAAEEVVPVDQLPKGVYQVTNGTTTKRFVIQ